MKFRTYAKEPELFTSIRETKATQEEKDKAEALLRPYARYGEYLDVEIDTEAGTVTLLRR